MIFSLGFTAIFCVMEIDKSDRSVSFKGLIIYELWEVKPFLTGDQWKTRPRFEANGKIAELLLSYGL